MIVLFEQIKELAEKLGSDAESLFEKFKAFVEKELAEKKAETTTTETTTEVK